ncbi:hypothetical protein KO498_04285 [Lentibacter algarum]|uniref:hypothetical protein n=1 Tax=Lentibacter algarum TaxID=576131 RepID=UPI001C06ADC3|nr:hypothetical protein [Lentibacter algarum]MBU2981026.1 hypothetical protein [Lentibacter algarum]
MVLTWKGNEAPTEIGVNRLAEDMDGNRVVVSGSHEAITDFGWGTIWQTAETKYARGEYQETESNRFVRVQTDDCKAQVGV